MQRLLLLLTLLLCAASAHARSYTTGDKPLRPGWWHDPERAGWAFTLSPSGDQLAGTLLTFDRGGEATWYLAVGRGDGRTWTLPVTQHLWNVAANRPLRSETIGTFTFTLESEGHARASWTIDGESGSAALELLELAPGYSAEDRSGHWFAQSEPGHGYTVYSQGDWLTMVHYGYDAAGRPRWVYADNHGEPSRKTMEAVYFRRACADCDATVHGAGTITLDLPLEHEGTAALALSLPAPLSGGFRREAQQIHLISDAPSGRVHPAALARFASDATLRDYLGAALERSGGASTFCYGIDFSPAPAGARSSSATNTQEGDVDELDLVDNDGEYVYSVFPATGSTPARLRTHRMQPQAADLVLASDIVLETDRNAPQPQGLYLVEASEGPRLLAIVSDKPVQCGNTESSTVVEIRGLADRGVPTARDRLVLDGSLVATRRIGRTLLVVTRHFANVPGLQYGSSAAVRARNEEILAALPLAAFLPTARLDGGAPVALVTPASTLLPPLPFGAREDWLLTITAVPLDDPGAHRSISVIGQDSAVYVSAGSLYLATSRYHAPTGTSISLPAYFTDIHRFGLDPLRYRASGSVRGFLNGSDLDKPFRLSEHDDRLRVLSDVWAPLSSFGRYELAVLQEDAATKRMNEVGRVPNAQRPQPIGKPGETVRAIRYLGERAYVVTFRQIDPLYALDLSVPTDPRIAGELEVPGFSSYLQPLPNGVLLGVGRDATSTGATAGVKVASFDVSTPASLRELSRHIVGGNRSYTQLENDHRAFAMLQPATGNRRFAFHGALGSELPSEVNSDGLLSYEIDAAGLLVPRGGVRAPLDGSGAFSTRMPDGTRYADTRTRAVLAGDAVYLYRGGWWFGSRWGSNAVTPPR
ncbi:MAG TPA: beta-propeller domain-containing protein [Xanthomonadales bacterium]|nr:beta-propeller domain-containing protein [Xanthomonadales bacterium]